MNPVSSAASSNPTTGQGSRAHGGGLLATLIDAARHQETLIDAITVAVDSGDKTAILEAAKNLAANRRRENPKPLKKTKKS